MKSITNPVPRSTIHLSLVTGSRTAYPYRLTPEQKEPTMQRKKEETIEDIIDRIEEDLKTIRDKACDDEEWNEEEPEDNDE